MLQYSQSLLIKTALATAIAVFNIQIIPVCAMQKESINEEQEPLTHKVVQVFLPPASQHNNIIDDYVDQLNRVSTQQEADIIIENILPHIREEVVRRLDEKNRGSSSSCMDFEEEQIESSKRKRVEKKEESSRSNNGHKRARIGEKEKNGPRTVDRRDESSKNSDFNLFDMLPFEMQAEILKFVKNRRDIANCRLVSCSMKTSMDYQTTYLSSLQRLSTLTSCPMSFTGKLSLSWAPTLKDVLPLLFSESLKLSGHIFVSRLEDRLPPNLKLKITLTVPNNEQAKSKLTELENQGLSTIVEVRSREALWKEFIEDKFVKEHQSRSSIIHGKNSLSFLLDIDGDRTLATKILSRYSVATVIGAFAGIRDEVQRAYAASLLNEEILSLCQTKIQFQQVIKALIKLPIDEPRKLILLSKKIGSKCKNGSQLSEVIKAGANISSARFGRIILFLERPQILNKCQNGNQLSEVITACANIPENASFESIILFLDKPNKKSKNSDKVLVKCKNGNQLSEVIKACANIPDPRYKSIISLVGKLDFLKRCEDGDRLSKVIEAAASISNEIPARMLLT